MVKPATGIGWHRRGFRWYWTWKVRHGHAGRQSVPRETRELIRILSRNNSTQLAESLHRLKLAGCTIATSASPNYLPLQFL